MEKNKNRKNGEYLRLRLSYETRVLLKFFKYFEFCANYNEVITKAIYALDSYLKSDDSIVIDWNSIESLKIPYEKVFEATEYDFEFDDEEDSYRTQIFLSNFCIESIEKYKGLIQEFRSESLYRGFILKCLLKAYFCLLCRDKEELSQWKSFSNYLSVATSPFFINILKKANMWKEE